MIRRPRTVWRAWLADRTVKSIWREYELVLAGFIGIVALAISTVVTALIRPRCAGAAYAIGEALEFGSIWTVFDRIRALGIGYTAACTEAVVTKRRDMNSLQCCIRR